MGGKNKPPIDLGGAAGIHKGNLQGKTHAGVNLPGFSAGSTNASSIGRSGVSDASSSNVNVGGIFKQSKSSAQSIGPGGLSSSRSQQTNIGGLTFGSDSHVDVSRHGLKFGEHVNIAGKKIGYSASIPAVNMGKIAKSMREAMKTMKNGAAVPFEQMASLAGSLRDHAKDLTHSIGHALHNAPDLDSKHAIQGLEAMVKPLVGMMNSCSDLIMGTVKAVGKSGVGKDIGKGGAEVAGAMMSMCAQLGPVLIGGAELIGSVLAEVVKAIGNAKL